MNALAKLSDSLVTVGLFLSGHLDWIDEYGSIETVGNPRECIVDRVGCVFRRDVEMPSCL